MHTVFSRHITKPTRHHMQLVALTNPGATLSRLVGASSATGASATGQCESAPSSPHVSSTDEGNGEWEARKAGRHGEPSGIQDEPLWSSEIRISCRLQTDCAMASQGEDPNTMMSALSV